MPPNREKLSVAVQIRADRTLPGEVAIVEALIAGAPSAVVAIALLEEVSEAVKRGNRATVVVQAVRVCPQEGAVVPAVVAAEEAEEVVVAVGAPAAVAAVDAGN